MRSRNIKPGFFKNEHLGVDEVDPLVMLLFAGLWCLADKEGRLEDRPLRIKAEVFPYRTVSSTLINEFLTLLEQQGFILRYAIENRPLIQVLNFDTHQSPHSTEKASTLPPPPLEMLEQARVTGLTVSPTLLSRELTQPERHDSLIHGLTDSAKDDSQIQDSPEVKPSGANVDLAVQAYNDAKELREAICRAHGRKPKVPMVTLAEWQTIHDIFDFWKTTFRKNAGTKLTVDRGRCVLDRLRPPMNYTLDDIKKAIEGCKLSPYHNSSNGESGGKVYDDLELICRDDAHLERFMGYYDAYGNGTRNGNGRQSQSGAGTAVQRVDEIIRDADRFERPTLDR